VHVAPACAGFGELNYFFFQMYTLLQDVQFTEQQRFKQLVSQSKARMEVLS
jgi:hypothetical protein